MIITIIIIHNICSPPWKYFTIKGINNPLSSCEKLSCVFKSFLRFLFKSCRFLKLWNAPFRYTWSLVAFSSVVAPFDITNPRDHIVLYFWKSYTLPFLVSPVLQSISSLLIFCSISGSFFNSFKLLDLTDLLEIYLWSILFVVDMVLFDDYLDPRIVKPWIVLSIYLQLFLFVFPKTFQEVNK